jgi:hypothetical protein
MILHYQLNRRLFLKLFLSLPGLFVNLHNKRVNAAQDQQSPIIGGYGSGAYSQGEYPGYKIYLSLITKEGK